MCVLYVSFGSKVRPRTFGCIAMGSAVLFIRLLLYSEGSGVNRVQVVLSGFRVILFCFLQVWLYVWLYIISSALSYYSMQRCIFYIYSCCCSPFSLVHLSLVFLPRDSRVPGLRPQVCSISPTVSWLLDELGN